MIWVNLVVGFICTGILVKSQVKAIQNTTNKTTVTSTVSPVASVSQAYFFQNVSDLGNQTVGKYRTVILESEPTISPSSSSVEVESTTEFSFATPIRVLPDGPIQMIFKPDNSDNFRKPEMEDVEETFTYQVRRQNRNRNVVDRNTIIKTDWANPSLQNKSNHEDNSLAINRIDATGKKVDELEKKVLNLLASFSTLEKKLNESVGGIKPSLVELKEKVNLLNESQLLHLNITEEIRKNYTNNDDRLENNIQTLSSHIRNAQSLVTDHILNSSKRLEHLASSIQNTTNEIRMTEVRTRYNQKALTTLDRLLQTNQEKITEMGLSVGPRWAEQTKGCGGVLVAEAGIISYKFRQPYLNNERCIWTIRANRRSRVILQLLEDGFQNSSNSDFITVTEFADEQPASLVTSSRIEHGNKAVHTFRGPLIFLTFYSDSSIPGNGFTVKFQGSGNTSSADELHAVRYRHNHIKESVGHIKYPDEKNVLYQPNEIATFALNPPLTSQLKVHLRYTDLEKEEGCEYDSVNFYGSVMASFALAKKYCEQQEVYTGESLQSSDGTFIVIFRSDSSTQFKGFQFSWEKL